MQRSIFWLLSSLVSLLMSVVPSSGCAGSWMERIETFMCTHSSVFSCCAKVPGVWGKDMGTSLCASSSCQPGVGQESCRQCRVNAAQFSAFGISQCGTITSFLVLFLKCIKFRTYAPCQGCSCCQSAQRKCSDQVWLVTRSCWTERWWV